MLNTQYHRGQQQSSAYKDNIRFLPKAIRDLLLQYITYFVPLRQLFLQQQKPGALISSYLWAKMNGSVWPDGTISACLTKACTRAKVPRLHTSNWRQFVALISKEKFTVKERANFGLEDNLGEDIEDELDLCSTNAYPISCGATRVLGPTFANPIKTSASSTVCASIKTHRKQFKN